MKHRELRSLLPELKNDKTGDSTTWAYHDASGTLTREEKQKMTWGGLRWTPSVGQRIG